MGAPGLPVALLTYRKVPFGFSCCRFSSNPAQSWPRTQTLTYPWPKAFTSRYKLSNSCSSTGSLSFLAALSSPAIFSKGLCFPIPRVQLAQFVTQRRNVDRPQGGDPGHFPVGEGQMPVRRRVAGALHLQKLDEFESFERMKGLEFKSIPGRLDFFGQVVLEGLLDRKIFFEILVLA